MTSAPSNQLPPGVSPNHPLGPLRELIDELRTHIQETAENGQSDDLGVRTITAGETSDALVPVFFLCTWPARARSRHILIWMKPSIPNSALEAAVNDVFRLIEAGGIIKKTIVVWDGEDPFADTAAAGITARDTVRHAVGLDSPPTQRQIIKIIEGAMNGFMEVVVGSVLDEARCFICHRTHPLTPGNEGKIHRSAFGPPIFCEDCVEELGEQEIDRIWDEGISKQKQRAQNSLSNPSA